MGTFVSRIIFMQVMAKDFVNSWKDGQLKQKTDQKSDPMSPLWKFCAGCSKQYTIYQEKLET